MDQQNKPPRTFIGVSSYKFTAKPEKWVNSNYRYQNVATMGLKPESIVKLAAELEKFKAVPEGCMLEIVSGQRHDKEWEGGYIELRSKIQKAQAAAGTYGQNAPFVPQNQQAPQDSFQPAPVANYADSNFAPQAVSSQQPAATHPPQAAPVDHRQGYKR